MSTVSSAEYAQRIRALECANEVRLKRAELKRRVRSGEVSAYSVVLHPPWMAQGMPVSSLLLAERGWGRTRMRKTLGRLEIPHHKPVGALTERQRERLASLLPARSRIAASEGAPGAP